MRRKELFKTTDIISLLSAIIWPKAKTVGLLCCAGIVIIDALFA